MPLCSKKLSLCCTVLSGWALIQLAIMGYLMFSQAVAFGEDLNIEINENTTYNNFIKEVDEKYQYAANNCWVAAGLYVGIFLISLQQFYSQKF